MKKIGLSVIAVWFATGALVAHAGLVMTQETTTNAGGAPSKSARTVMVQGSKQKVLMDNQSIIIDLDKGLMTMIMPEAKSYQEMPFPPKGPMASMMQGMGGINLDFKKAGGRKTVAGYSCDEYTGAGHMMMGDYTVNACFSKDAPAAGEYTAFTRQLLTKVKGTSMAGLASAPDGVPLTMVSTTKVGGSFQVPGMTPEQSKALGQMMANRPPTVSTTTTTSIKSQSLPTDTFSVPSGFTKKEFNMPGLGGMGSPGAGAAGAPGGAKPPAGGDD